MNVEKTSADLLRRVKDGEAAAQEEFVRQYQPVLEGFARAFRTRTGERLAARLRADPDFIAGVVQAAMTALLRRLATFEYDSTRGFHRYARTVINNHIRTELRKRHDLQVATRMLEQARGPGQSSAGHVARRELRRRIDSYLDDLRRQEHNPIVIKAFEMIVLEQRPVAEVCAALGMTADEAYSAKHRVTRRLRARFERDGLTWSRLI